MARLDPIIRLKRVDLPTFGRPAKTTAGSLEIKLASALTA
jgi:hypothetical protein